MIDELEQYLSMASADAVPPRPHFTLLTYELHHVNAGEGVVRMICCLDLPKVVQSFGLPYHGQP